MADKLTQLLSQKIDFSRFTLYQNLTLYDKIIKELNIDPANPAALSAYELICREYINPKTPSQSSKAPSSPQNTISMDINDPEMMGHFSFAKKPLQLQHRDMKPERLFMEKREDSEKKGLSQQIRSKYNQMKFNKNHVSNFQLPLADFEKEDLSKDDWKQKSRKKLQDTQSKEAELMITLKAKYFEELSTLMRFEKAVIVKQLRIKSAVFLHETFLVRKSWKIFISWFGQRKKIKESVVQFVTCKKEIILEQFFIAWKQRALMTQAQRAFEADIHLNYEKLAKIRMFKLLRKNHQVLKLRQDQIQQKQNLVILHLKISQEQSIMRSLKNNLCRNKEQQNKYQQLSRTIKLRQAQLCLKITRQMKIRQEARQQRLIKKMQKYIHGYKFIKKMKLDYQIGKVYWKNPQKIVFLKMIFESISDSLSRQGQNHQWMRQLPICLAKTDRKLNHFQRLTRLSSLFGAFKQYLCHQQQKINQVKAIIGKRLLKMMINNYKIEMLKEKQRCQTEGLSQILYQSKLIFGFQLFLSNTDRYSRRKDIIVNQNLLFSKVKNSLAYLNANRVAKKYYRQKLQKFETKLETNLLRNVFLGFKQITLTQIVNKRIVQQFRDYRNIVITEAIFCCLKGFSSEQKQLKRRMQNLRRIRISSYFGQLTFNMRVAMYGSYKERIKLLKLRQKKVKDVLQIKMCKSLFKGLNKNKLAKLICSKIDQQYQQKLKRKTFFCLHTICQKRMEQKSKSLEIKLKNDVTIKRQTMSAFINTFLIMLMLKNADKIARRVQLKLRFKKLKQFGQAQLNLASYNQVYSQKQ